MNATEEWLRYIETKVIMDKYNIKGYSNDNTSSDESGIDSSNSELQSINS